MAARGELVDLHHEGGKAHGAMAPAHIRLALFDTPYGSRAHLPRHADGDVPAPLKYLYGSTRTAADEARAAELATLALAIAQLTEHPDPGIDALLRDVSQGSGEVLKDVLLEGGLPVEQLLLDRAGVALPRRPLAGEDDEAIDDELEALWHRVLELDPMIDTTNPAVFDLAGPDL